ncbi:uncharacterized protein LOC131649522 [Vicia villosa]|uniref:uncharacterized protein LOC131649522 n=1 Tax=Vicia villosa TaxID=3911 RepID=UPI00273C05F2|nr:uncharacterized protein LOC131649522 [Vicia villosa]
MWVRKGIISIIDLSNDYYLVAFSHEDDKKAAMLNGSWFIYDHYLTVKEWRPNFQPKIESINEVVVWVRIAGLPIEYCDSRVLTCFGNRIGRTVKVDKTTMKQERGKYARICVTVNLSKPLLAMLRIQGSCYKIEYEGLHLLCLVCGRYGHYKESCSFNNKGKNLSGESSNGERHVGKEITRDGGGQGEYEVENGPWKIVQKQRKGKKPVDGRKNTTPTIFNGKINAGGSRFLILENEDIESNAEVNTNHDKNNPIMENDGTTRMVYDYPIMANVPNTDKINKNNAGADVENMKENNNKNILDSLTSLEINAGA